MRLTAQAPVRIVADRIPHAIEIMPRPNPSSALSDLLVVDLSRVRAGPTCARIFADFGADVIKVESPPGYDPNEAMSGPRHGYDMQNLHRNKRSLTLDLKIGRASCRERV